MKAVYTPPGDTPTSYDHDDQPIRILTYEVEHGWTEDASGVRHIGSKRMIQIEWEIRSTTQTLLAAKMALAEAAYQGADKVGGSLIVKHDNGDTSRHTMPAADGYAGVGTRVLKFGYRENGGVEYATKRTAYAILSHGVIIDLLANSPVTPGNPGDDYDSGTEIPGYDWDAGDGGGYPNSGSGAQVYGQTESYNISGGNPIDVVEELPPPATGTYVWRKTNRGKRFERHAIEISSRTQFVSIPPTIISSGGGEIQRDVNVTRAKGKPPTYTTSVTYTKES